MCASIPTSVTTGVLPLSAKAHGVTGDVERAAFLVASLGQRWRDAEPFRLIVVSPAADTGPVGAALPSVPGIHIEVLAEDAFFGPRDAFHGLPGWWKQQVIKLVAPAVLRVGPYLTFDADVADADMAGVGNPLRARFADSDGEFDDLMSCNAGVVGNRCITPTNEVPVPGTLGLLGLGLIGLGAVRRKQLAA